MLRPMRFVFAPSGAPPPYDAETAIGCDGLPPARLRLSHWPGNTTPPDLRRDLSTGIALAFASLPDAERGSRFGTFDVVANDHFDCDGLLSVFACLRPGEALPRADAMLAAALAGDLWRAPSRRALAVDLVVSAFTDPDRSPLGSALRGLAPEAADALAYEALLERLPALLDDPFATGTAIDDELARVEEDLRWLRSGAVAITRVPAVDLAVLHLSRAIDPRASHEVGACDRILELRATAEGTFAELRITAASWFDLPSERALPRPDLAALAERLQQSERGDGRWLATASTKPFPFLLFGTPRESARVREAPFAPRPSSQPPDAVERTVVAFLRESLR